MKIQLKRSGGFAGILEVYPVIIVNELPNNIKDHLIELIDDIDFFRLPSEIHSEGYDFIYTKLIIEKMERNTVLTLILCDLIRR